MEVLMGAWEEIRNDWFTDTEYGVEAPVLWVKGDLNDFLQSPGT